MGVSGFGFSMGRCNVFRAGTVRASNVSVLNTSESYILQWLKIVNFLMCVLPQFLKMSTMYKRHTLHGDQVRVIPGKQERFNT